MEFHLTNPDEIAAHWGETPEAVGRHIIEGVAIEDYRAGHLSQRQVGQMLGLDYWEAEDFLKRHDVALNYSAADLKSDRITLRKLLGGS